MDYGGLLEYSELLNPRKMTQKYLTLASEAVKITQKDTFLISPKYIRGTMEGVGQGFS